MNEIHQLLQQLTQGAFAAIIGMGGVGKTELALQYTRQYRHVYPGGICWIVATDVSKIGPDLLSLSKKFFPRFGLTIPGELGLKDQVDYCWRHWPAMGQILVILDDVTKYSEIEPYLPLHLPRFKVLLTTRLRLETPYILTLNVLSEQFALDLLHRWIDVEWIPEEILDAKKLCQWLGYLPLALNLVGRYIKRRKLSLVEILNRLEKDGLRHPSLDVHKGDRTSILNIPRGVAAAFELSWGELSETAQELGCFLSLFALTPIPWKLVEEASIRRDLEELESARMELEDFHLLQGEKVYHLHQLTREFFSEKLKTFSKLDDLSYIFKINMVSISKRISDMSTLDEITDFSKIFAEINLIIPHITEQFEHSLKVREYDIAAELLLAIDYYLMQWGNYKSVVKNHQSLRGKISDFNLNIGSLFNLGQAYRHTGNYSMAIACYKEVISCNNLLKDKKYIKIAIASLASCYSELGQIEKAIKLYWKALGIIQRDAELKKLNGRWYNNLGVCYAELGQIKSAVVYYKRALRISIETNDLNSQGICLGNLCDAYGVVGRSEFAIKLGEKALALYKKNGDLAGEGTSLHSLAELQLDQHHYIDALKYAGDGLAIGQKLNSPKIQSENYSVLACIYLYMGVAHLSDALLNAELAIQCDFPQNNPYSYLLKGLITLQYGVQKQKIAGNSFEKALALSSNLLFYSNHNSKALDVRWLALCGLAISRDSGYAEEATQAYNEARGRAKDYSGNKGVVARNQRLLGTLLPFDSRKKLNGLLKHLNR